MRPVQAHAAEGTKNVIPAERQRKSIRMMKGLNIFMLLVISVWVNGQGMINDQPKMLFNNEQTVGVFLNSNGIGADFRYARMIDVR
jgi:predicted nucleic acid-binding Zn ribbon protein